MDTATSPTCALRPPAVGLRPSSSPLPPHRLLTTACSPPPRFLIASSAPPHRRYALHPGVGISAIEQPKHAEAARRTLRRRLRSGGGHVGWSSAWAVSLWARLGEGSLAHAALRYTMHEFASDALLGLHPVLKGKVAAGGASCVTCVGRKGGAGSGVYQVNHSRSPPDRLLIAS